MTIVVMVTLPSGIYTASIITLELSRGTSRVIYNDIYVTSHSNPSNLHEAGGFFFQPFRALEGIFTCYIDLSYTRWSTIGKGYPWHLNMPKIVPKKGKSCRKFALNCELIVTRSPGTTVGEHYFTWIDWDRKYTLLLFLIIISNVVKKSFSTGWSE